MSSNRFQDRHAGLIEELPQIPDLPDAESEVVLVEDFTESSGHRFQIASRQPAVSRKPFDQNEHIRNLAGPFFIIEAEKSADVHEAVLLGGHGATVAITEQLLSDVQNGTVRIGLLPFLDEEAIFGETAGVEKERNAMPMKERPGLSDVFHRDGLPAAAVVGNRQ